MDKKRTGFCRNCGEYYISEWRILSFRCGKSHVCREQEKDDPVGEREREQEGARDQGRRVY